MRKLLLFLLVTLLAVPVIAWAQEIKIDLPETYREVLAGENLWFTTKVSGLPDGTIAELNYEIFGPDGKLKASKFDFVEIGTHESFTGKIKVPENLGGEECLLKVSVKKEGADDGVLFEAIRKSTQNQEIIKNSLFDIVVEIPKSYRTLAPGDELLSSIKLVNLGSEGRIDVFLDYWIVDSEDNIVLKKTETVAVETQANFVRSFDVPENVSPGNYRLYAKITYADGKFADGEHSFVVRESADAQVYYVAISILAAVVIIFVLIKSKPFMEKIHVKLKVSRIVRKRNKK